jgi:hypothetical protein
MAVYQYLTPKRQPVSGLALSDYFLQLKFNCGKPRVLGHPDHHFTNYPVELGGPKGLFSEGARAAIQSDLK